jgi:hypothetical protein
MVVRNLQFNPRIQSVWIVFVPSFFRPSRDSNFRDEETGYRDCVMGFSDQETGFLHRQCHEILLNQSQAEYV